MFNEIVDIFYPHIHKGNVYYISRGSLKFANKKFTSIKHEYELTLDRLSVLQQAADDGSIGGIDFSFTPISEMPGRNKDDIVDVIGVVMKAEARSEVTVQKQTQQERAVAKRNVTLIDTQGACIDLTLWGPHAENVDEDLINAHPVLAVKGAKVSDYNSRTLNCSGAAVLEWNPNLEEASQLRAWFDSNPSVTPSVNLSVSNRSGSGFTGFSKQNAPLKTFAQAKENQPDATVCVSTLTEQQTSANITQSHRKCTSPEPPSSGFHTTTRSSTLLAAIKTATVEPLPNLVVMDILALSARTFLAVT